MTKRGLALSLAVVMVWAIAVPAFGQANPFRDVPRDHWAYDAVATLAAAGLVEGYPDGTFGGERTFTRYEMAMVFARILARLEALLDEKIDARVGALATVEEVVLPDGTVGTSIRLTPEMERAILELVGDPERAAAVAGATVRLAEEFASELELLGVRVAELERLFANVNTRLIAVEQQLAEIRSMAETARGVAEAANAAAQAAEEAAAEAQAKADWAWQVYERLKASGASDDEIVEALALATGVQGDADSAAERAYRARLAAERATALANQALEAADRAEKMGQMSYDEARKAYELASQALSEVAAQGEQARSEALRAMERAQRADQQAYRARLTADRALARVEALEEQVGEIARRPVIGGEFRAEYELTHTSNPADGVRLDPRDGESDTIKDARKLDLTLALTTSFKPSEDTTVDGGVKARARVFGEDADDVDDFDDFDLANMWFDVTQPGRTFSALLGDLTGEDIAKGFNKYTLDADTYEARVDSVDRRGAVLEAQVGNFNGRLIASRLDSTAPEKGLYGIAAGFPVGEGMNLEANYLWWSEADRVASVRAYGELGRTLYDAIYARFREDAAYDIDLKTGIGVIDLGLNFREVPASFAPSNPTDPKAEDLKHFGKLLDEDDGDLLWDQRRYVARAEAPAWIATVLAEKGRHDKTLAGDSWTDWTMFGFKDLDLLGFNVGARAYNDTRDNDRETQILRLDVSREFRLGLPFKFTVSHANAKVTNLAAWQALDELADWNEDEQEHLAVGLAVEDYALTPAWTLSASVKTEKNPITDDEWTEPDSWKDKFEDDSDNPYRKHYRDTASAAVKFAATDALTLSAGYTVERWDTVGDGERNVSVYTTDLGADYTLNVSGADVRLGYGYQLQNIVGGGIVHTASPRHTYSIGVKRQLLGATWDAAYKVVMGRGTDGVGKVNAIDTMGSLNVTYPITEAAEFVLTGKWGSSLQNRDTDDNYYYSSIQAGFGIKF
ncbi:MAG TPA: S-layer homology domain-containing protein [Limnochordales bacterium]